MPADRLPPTPAGGQRSVSGINRFAEVEHSRSPGAFRFYNRLKRVHLYVELEYTQDIRLGDAARVAGLEPSYFSRFFRQKTGVCFSDWVAEVRIEHAKDLLRARNLAISEVAAQVGFRSVRTFERQFLRCAGCSPSHFKASVRPS